MNSNRYVGRFAPSPTGPLHFGSLVAAAGSYLDARAAKGDWLVRIEDVDTARCSPRWSSDILRTLERFGLVWDREVVFQSDPAQQARYQETFETLRRNGMVYGCACSRREIAESQGGTMLEGELRYAGLCRAGMGPGRNLRAWRVRVSSEEIAFTDRLAGPHAQNLQDAIGDFVIRRADGLFAYQLAVVVDDGAQGVTDVVRGCDLLSSTPRQIYLQRLLRLQTPRYLHLPLALNADGQKLSKQTGAKALDDRHPSKELWNALRFLHLSPPREAQEATPHELWRWGVQQWAQLYPL